MGADTVFASGSLVNARDETWMINAVEQTGDGSLLRVRGVSNFVADKEAVFFTKLENIKPFDMSNVKTVADNSSHYRNTRLWLESVLAATAVPMGYTDLTVSRDCLADPLSYQLSAVSKALKTPGMHPRMLIADAVGLGKTLEIGMILSELIRRKRGDRILVVAPRQVLEQFQHEMWTRFAIPFMRLDSRGVKAIKQKLPATQNPFAHYQRVLISIDTLKKDVFKNDLRRYHWDAVVLDEAHNVSNRDTQNNRLAQLLAPHTDTLILASATPHNGREDSFAELVKLLDPSLVSGGQVDKERLPDVMVRRHRHSDEVKGVVGDSWAVAKEPRNELIPASEVENAVGSEIADVWTHPVTGASPVSGGSDRLFPWTIAKSFFSSPSALDETLHNRLRVLDRHEQAAVAAQDSLRLEQLARERAALVRLRALNEPCLHDASLSAKYVRLRGCLAEMGVGLRPDGTLSPERVVVFAERVPTLEWLRKNLLADTGLTEENIAIMHGGMDDVDQQRLVEEFKRGRSPLRILVTGDVASEGVNLHAHCHRLVHYDVPWSLIRIEQRNGRIDRYGQRVPPQIYALLLRLAHPKLVGDVHVLQRLLEREREAHRALGDSGSLLGAYSPDLEEKAITRVLEGRVDFDEAVPSVAAVAAGEVGTDWARMLLNGDLAGVQAALAARADVSAGQADQGMDHAAATGLWRSRSDFLEAGVVRLFDGKPERDPKDGGIAFRREGDPGADGTGGTLSFVPDTDLRARLEVLPKQYRDERGVMNRLVLTEDRALAGERLVAARGVDSSSFWPDTHFLSPLHPALEWVANRVRAKQPPDKVFTVVGKVDTPTVLVQLSAVNQFGYTLSSALLRCSKNDFTGWSPEAAASPRELFADLGLGPDSPGIAVAQPERFGALVKPALECSRTYMEAVREAANAQWEQALAWMNPEVLRQRGMLDPQAGRVSERAVFARPVLVVVPEDMADVEAGVSCGGE
ncbi:helicase-related protein [Dermabacteraceae bacterium P13077]